MLDHDASKAEVPPGTGGALGAGEVFARDVVVRGWKIVGGKGFVDKAKVGAYVGALRETMGWATADGQCTTSRLSLGTWVDTMRSKVAG